MNGAPAVTSLESESPTTSWALPLTAVSLVAGLLAYLRLTPLDSIERRLITTQTVVDSTIGHVRLVAVSTLLVVGIAVPLGILLTRPAARWAAPAVLGLANAGQAVPSIGILVLLAILYGIGFWMAVVSLVLYAILPVLRNTMVGIRQVDHNLVDAARGMGMRPYQVLLLIELPQAVPIMLAGIRVALILNVGVATLATYTNAGGLGMFIESGIVFNRTAVILTGSVLTIALALLVDWLAGLAERWLSPRGR